MTKSHKNNPSSVSPSGLSPSGLSGLGHKFTLVLVVIGVLLVALELVVHRHGVNAVEESFLFPAIYGFVAFLFIVQVGKWLRLLIMRPEDYYDE
jgi:hypothetical protein